ncbi:MAG: hypothetical protein AB7H97_16400 [Pseudobdellovibrionaceae bacterium]
MLINCPKCGFSQPKDRYCAKCGVDIEVFRPPAPSPIKKFLSHPAFQISVLVAIVASAYVYIKQKEAREIEKRIEFLAGGANSSREAAAQDSNLETTSIGGGQALDVEGSDPALAHQNVDVEAGVNSFESDAPPPTESAVTARTAGTPAAATDAASAVAKAAEVLPSLTVMYAEVSSSLFQKIMEEAQNRGQFEFGEYVYGVIPNIKTRLRTSEANSGIKIIQSVKKTFTAIKTPLQWFLGSEEAGNRFGFTTSISVNEMSENDLAGEIEVQSSMPQDPQGVPVRRSYPATFEIPRGAGVFMAGVLTPKTGLNPSEQDIYNKSVLRVMTSPQFQNEQTTFVIFFEFDRE